MTSLTDTAASLPRAARPWSWSRTAFLAAGVVGAVQVALTVTGNSAVLHGTLLDPDCYMHLQRAFGMMMDRRWHEVLDPRVNAPMGYAIHWTAVFDTLLVLGAAPLRLIGLDPHTALYVWGSVISPLLLMAALAVFAWGVRTRVSGLLFLWLTVLIFTQPEFSGAFIAGRPDHHSLVLGLLLAQLAWLYALFDGHAGPRWAMATGVLAGLQLCTSVEALLTIALVGAALLVVWLLYGRRCLQPLAIYLAAGAATVIVWLLWEHGPFLVEAAYERVSVAHLTALGCGAAAIATLAFVESGGAIRGRAARFAALASAILVAALPMAAVFPGFFLGPWAHLDPAIAAWHHDISELQPLLPTDLHHFAMFLGQFAAVLLALPLVALTLWRGRPDDRPVMLVSLLGFVLFGALAQLQMRWSAEAQAVMLLPWTLTTQRIMQSGVALRWRNTEVPLRSFALAGALLLQLVPTALAQDAPVSLSQFTTHPAGVCDWGGAARALPPEARGILMTRLWYGPEILWRTRFDVVGAPYEIPPAIADTDAFFNGGEPAAHAIAARRGISFVLVCTHDRGEGFGGALAAGKAPSWLRPAPFHNGPSGFRFFRVVRPSLSGV